MSDAFEFPPFSSESVTETTNARDVINVTSDEPDRVIFAPVDVACNVAEDDNKVDNRQPLLNNEINHTIGLSTSEFKDLEENNRSELDQGGWGGEIAPENDVITNCGDTGGGARGEGEAPAPTPDEAVFDRDLFGDVSGFDLFDTTSTLSGSADAYGTNGLMDVAMETDDIMTTAALKCGLLKRKKTKSTGNSTKTTRHKLCTTVLPTPAGTPITAAAIPTTTRTSISRVRASAFNPIPPASKTNSTSGLTAALDSVLKYCNGCSRAITDRYLLKVAELYWHEDCLKCSTCSCRLGDVGLTLFTKANMLFCRKDYFRLFGASGCCSLCSKQIQRFEMVMKVKGHVYHVNCFACQQCNHRFTSGDRYYLIEGKILCEGDCKDRLVALQALLSSSPGSQAQIPQLKRKPAQPIGNSNKQENNNKQQLQATSTDSYAGQEKNQMKRVPQLT